MKIKVKSRSFEEVCALKPSKHKSPKKPNVFWRTLLKLVSLPDLWATAFECEKIGMEKLSKKEPCFVLMNHSSFIDLEIAASVMYPRPFNIVATTDSFMGKAWLMRQIGCIPTKKYVAELSLVRDITYAIKKKKCSVLMYPEAGYTFDGRRTPFPDTVARMVKRLGVPLVTIITDGAFLREPLYNSLQPRRVKVSAKMEYLLSPEQIAEMTAEQIQEVINERFSFDAFRAQQERRIRVCEPFRADHLNRVLYKCPHCMAEGKMQGKGTMLTCTECNKSYELDEYGYLAATDGESRFTHIPDWYDWERECVRREIESGEYGVSLPVKIYMSIDEKRMYSVGEGVLTHTDEGLRVVGCDGKLDHLHTPQQSHSISSEFYFYEIGDVICLGNHSMMLYCFPETEGDIVTKIRLAAEEQYKMTVQKKARK